MANIRTASWQNNQLEPGTATLNLLENGRIVHSQEYTSQELLEQAKNEWLSGNGPELLEG